VSDSTRPVITLRKADLPAATPQEREQNEQVAATEEKKSQEPSLDSPAGGPNEDAAPAAEGVGDGAMEDKSKLADVNDTTKLPHPGDGDAADGHQLLPPMDSGPVFVQGNTTDTTGSASAFTLTGSHFLMIATSRFPGGTTGLSGITAPYMGHLDLNEFGQANKVGPFVLASAKGGTTAFSAGGEGVTDAASGSRAFHFAAGYPTLPFDMQWLQLNAPVATYTVFAGSLPTGFVGAPRRVLKARSDAFSTPA